MVPTIKYFHIQGGDVNVVDGERHTPIHVAAHTGHAAILTFLTQVMMKIMMIMIMMIVMIMMMMMMMMMMNLSQSRFSPGLSLLTIYQDTPLHLACYSGKEDAARVLMTAARGEPALLTR